jgi:hypothetical protein
VQYVQPSRDIWLYYMKMTETLTCMPFSTNLEQRPHNILLGHDDDDRGYRVLDASAHMLFHLKTTNSVPRETPQATLSLT